jgi:hypothetical protein
LGEHDRIGKEALVRDGDMGSDVSTTEPLHVLDLEGLGEL